MSIFTVLIIQLVLSLMTISPTLINQFNILINLAVTINLIPYVLSMASVSCDAKNRRYREKQTRSDKLFRIYRRSI